MTPLRLLLPLAGAALSGCAALAQVHESSGLAPSAAGCWTINDGPNAGGPGDATLYEWDRGRVVRRVAVPAPNRDWEDLDRFAADGREYLLIADIGDNGARRSEVQLHLVPLPPPGAEAVPLLASIRFRYPRGPRDAESVAVIPGTWRALVLSKRERPAQVYEVDLMRRDGVQEARRLGPLAALPEAAFFVRLLYPWLAPYADHPTGLALHPDGHLAAVSTYDDAYLFRRRPDESWPAALAREPQRLELPDAAVYEGITFHDGALYVSREMLDGVVRVELPPPASP